MTGVQVSQVKDDDAADTIPSVFVLFLPAAVDSQPAAVVVVVLSADDDADDVESFALS